jgi:hypothetical protein
MTWHGRQPAHDACPRRWPNATTDKAESFSTGLTALQDYKVHPGGTFELVLLAGGLAGV